jgi:hypothetical protein
MIVTPYFNNLFPGEEATIEGLLGDIPSKPVLELIALIDAELYSKDEGKDAQIKILNFILARQSPDLRVTILRNAIGGSSMDLGSQQFFSRHYNLQFLHYILLHFREGELEDFTPEQELNVFKAYFLVAQLSGEQPRTDKGTIPPFGPDYFAQMLWPSLADNFEINFRIHPYHIMIRGVVFLNYLQFHTKYTPFVEQYLKKHGKVTNLNYVLDIFMMLNSNFETIKQGKSLFASFTLGRSPGFDSLFDQFTLNTDEYKLQFSEKKENYAGIKSRPLFKLDETTWLVLNWSFLSNKLYEGLVFDFYNASGIASTKEFSQFLKFKQFIGEQITEKHLFRLLAEKAFRKKHDVLLYDAGKPNGFPDVYYRKGNKVFLVEIKDAYFPSDAVNSFSYDAIKEAIDKKLNSHEKGTGQIIKQLVNLKQRSFEEPQRYKHPRNLIIYPIIIYTDIHFSMPGINEYVNRTFRSMVEEAGLDSAFNKIKPLTMININYLIGIFDVLGTTETSLDKQIDYFHHQLANRAKKYIRTMAVNDHQTLYDLFENVTADLIARAEFGRKYIEWTTDALKLQEGLPSV